MYNHNIMYVCLVYTHISRFHRFVVLMCWSHPENPLSICSAKSTSRSKAQAATQTAGVALALRAQAGFYAMRISWWWCPDVVVDVWWCCVSCVCHMFFLLIILYIYTYTCLKDVFVFLFTTSRCICMVSVWSKSDLVQTLGFDLNDGTIATYVVMCPRTSNLFHSFPPTDVACGCDWYSIPQIQHNFCYAVREPWGASILPISVPHVNCNCLNLMDSWGYPEYVSSALRQNWEIMANSSSLR